MTIRDQVFLYCHLVYGQQKEEIFSVLPPDRSEMLKKELHKFDRFPKEVRLTLVLKLLGYLVQHVRNPHLEMIHPTWIAESLRKEDPQFIALILTRLTPEYRAKVLSYLRLSVPSIPPAKVIPMESLDVLFRVFCNRFLPMGAPLGEAELSIDTIHLLKEEDLLNVIEQVGLREIARGFAMVGDAPLAAVLSRFPPKYQKDFGKAIKLAKGEPADKKKIVVKRLSKYDLASMPIDQASVRIGLAKIGAALRKAENLKRKIAQRISMDLGTILMQGEIEELLDNEEGEILAELGEALSKKRIKGQDLSFSTETELDRTRTKNT